MKNLVSEHSISQQVNETSTSMTLENSYTDEEILTSQRCIAFVRD